jgi:hypothetical protein
VIISQPSAEGKRESDIKASKDTVKLRIKTLMCEILTLALAVLSGASDRDPPGPRGAHLVFVLEFLVFSGDGRRVIEKVTHRAKSVDQARRYAASIMKNIVIDDRRADLCEVKDQMGNILAVVPAPP